MQIQTPSEKIELLLQAYGSPLFRLGRIMLGNESDAEDILQDTLLRYLQKAPSFQNAEHEKAWLFRVYTNLCHDLLRYRK